MIVIFVEFIDQLIDYPINRASPRCRGLRADIEDCVDILADLSLLWANIAQGTFSLVAACLV